ncbi:MAG: HAMP domain-containing histidine kinase [Oscillospiraceae bacterium]|nr:HAMP domain-containing histidine kinase [Oscillospiraceae bacterium]
MKNSIYFRIFIATALIVLLSFSLLGGLSTFLSYRRTMSDKRDMIVSTVEEMARYIVAQHLHHGVNLDDLELSMWLATVSNVTGFDLLVTDANGVVKSCSSRTMHNIGKIVPECILESARDGETCVARTTIGEIHTGRRQVSGTPLCMNVNGEMRTFGYVFVTCNLYVFQQEWRNFYSIFIIVALSVMIVTFIITFLLTKKQAEPINEMANAARHFAHGDFSVRINNYNREDKIGQLTKAFNAMADSLQSSEQLRRDFVANLSHELRTPMTVVSGFADGLLDGTISQENEKKYLEVISSETKRLSRLVQTMFDISTLQAKGQDSLSESSFDISEVVRLALLSVYGKVENKQLDVEAKLPDEKIMTHGNSDSITQVVFNLLDNAIKFSNPGGVIGVELWVRGPKAYVSVTNQGVTIAPDELPQIFERFHKADRARSADRDGVGLGLYIVKMILDNHNEDIFVTSKGGITKFIFSLTVCNDRG